jgi:lauroyl/myristoyl acyltransferase
MVRNEDDSFTLRFENPLTSVVTNDKNNDFIGLIRRYNGIIEDYIRKYPDQWYMFRRFWIS